MTRELREVWATYRGDGALYGISLAEPRLHPEFDVGWTAKRLPLLTDADRKVLEAADALERQWEADHANAFCEAVRARRAARDHVADAGKKGEA